MADSRDLIAWNVLRENYIAKGVPVEELILEQPEFRLVYDPSPSRLGMRLRLGQGRSWSRADALQNVTVRSVLLSGTSYVEVLTDSKELFRPIYALISNVLSRIADGEPDGLRALELSLGDFEALVARSAQLSREKAVGLYGELWVLHSLLLNNRVKGVDCWIGNRRETHDFRLGSVELEVKTTTANVRKHVIHGLNQLSPSPNHVLRLVSIRLGSPGSNQGQSVNDLVVAIRAVISGDDLATRRFDRSLAECGYEGDHAECAIPYQLAAQAMAVAIGADFPILSYEWLSKSLGSEPASRVRDMSLTLDLEGLGAPFDVTHYSS